MKKINYLWTVLIAAIGLFSCEDEWDDHYAQKQMQVVSGSNVEIVETPSVDYLAKEPAYKEAYEIFKENGLIKQLEERNQSYTLLLCENDALEAAELGDLTYFINSSVSDVCMSPTDMLVEGASIKMWCGKYLKITTETMGTDTKADGDVIVKKQLLISGTKVVRVVKTQDAYIYVMEKPVLAPKSLYEVFTELDDTRYSLFKELVKSYEIREFDRANSTPSGIDATGNTIYDSVFVIKNTYLDRYKSNSTTLTWNMRSEAYNSTMLIPDNEVFAACMTEACTNVKNSLGREPNAADTLKFREWIARACFYDKVLEPEDLMNLPTGEDVTERDVKSISGYQESSTLNIDGAVWRPSVQLVDAENPILLSNGKAYHVNYMHIPNGIVIWRIKHRLYNTYNGCTAEEKEEYFRWTNVGKNIGTRNINGGQGDWLWNDALNAYTWPKVNYDYLYGCPSGKAFDEKLPVALEFTGLALNADGTVSKALVPPGEYTLSMGWMSNKQKWTMEIYFNGKLLKKGISPTKAHYDRTKKGYPEYYDVTAMKKIDSKADTYDCDGYALGTVVVEGEGLQEIVIKQVSYDMTTAYSASGTTTDENGNIVSKDGSDSKNACMLCYHWCLRPTSNNY